jgi:thiol-disulfide isomerase/thioredoxin
VTTEEPRPSPAAGEPRRDRWGRQIIGPFTLRHIVVLLGTLLGVGVLLVVLTTPLSAPAPTQAPQPGASFVVVGEVTDGLAVGQRAPELSGLRDGVPVQLTDLDGEEVRLADLRGGPVWVNFWASWCPPCQEELPVLRTMDQAYRDRGLSIVGVSVQESSAEDVKAYAETYGLDYTIGFDARSEVFKAWLGFGLPTHYFLDADGIIRVRHYGPLSLAAATTIVEGLLAEQAASPGASVTPGSSLTPAPSLAPAPSAAPAS